MIGASRDTLPLDARERLALTPCDSAQAYEALSAIPGVGEILILSTCNRIEIYYTLTPCHEDPAPALIDWLCRRAGDAASLEAAFYAHADGNAARHLFRVAAGLESPLLGETEITAQVKQAYVTARASGCAGPVINRLFQKALHCTKQLRASSGISAGPVSLGAVVVAFVREVFGRELSSCRLLLWGAGKAAETTARHLIKHGSRELWIVNRTQEKARELASLCGRSQWLSWEQAMRRLPEADIALVCTQAPHYVVGLEDLEASLPSRDGRPLCLIDLAVPRNVDPRVASLPGVSLYNIDDLWKESLRNRNARSREVEGCETLIRSQVEHFTRWLDEQGKRKAVLYAES